ncbi:MAG: hypothetical protein VX519_00875 [Myxococcota bacterium]|nr:hypothetical protein [Myxococcota bacterium]
MNSLLKLIRSPGKPMTWTNSKRIGLLTLASLAISGQALALSCDEIMNMVNVNVPTHIVVQTMEDSGQQFTNADVRCLIGQGAPPEVVSTAKNLSATVEEAAPEPAPGGQPDARDEYEEREMIGEDRRRRRRSAYEDLPEDGQDDVPTTACDREIEDAIDAFRAKKPLASSKMLYTLLEGAKCPDETTRIHYYLARTLYELKMYHSAQHYFMQVVRKGPANKYFKHALPKLVAIARYTDNNSELQRIVHKIPASEYPRQAKNYLLYLMGIRLYDQDALSDARRYFAQISTKSDLYLRSKYFEGVIFNQQGRLKSAVKSFRDVIRDSEGLQIYSEKELESVNDLTDLSLLNVARVYYSIQRFDEASKYYGLVPRTSNYWGDALFEQAWSTFMQNDLNQTLGLILTVRSPYYNEDEFLPEADLLRALTFFNLCEYNQVESELLRFEGTIGPMFDELKDFTDKYRTAEGRKLADQAFDTYMESAPNNTTLPTSMFKKFLRNKDFSALVRHLYLMDSEEARIDAQKSVWKNSVGKHLQQVIEKDRQRYKRRAGLLLLAEMARTSQYLGDLLTQSEIIRFEVVSAQRADYAYKMQNPDLLNQFQGLSLDFATSVEFIYWPFNGEFWEDELGYYRYTEQGSCR